LTPAVADRARDVWNHRPPPPVCSADVEARRRRVDDMKRHVGSALVTMGTAAAVLLATAGAAAAHIDPDPRAAQAGTTATISFGLEHGCGDSPTTALAFKLPAGVSGVRAVDKTGWKTAVTATQVDFTGGSQDAHTPTEFAITLTLPATAGTILFPVVQTCAAGSLSWIEVAEEGKAEPEHPAPAVKVTAGAPTAADLAAAEDEDAHDHGDGHTGRNVVIGVGVAVVVVGAVAGGLARRRRTGRATT
jgi:periplasmic copper chaperone A